ncbi:MAG: glycosyl hydrolase family protein [Verrucomicrobia bacterium]|nr:glycosyl hydrolase family protein [Verrucomicrobiota bacterium]
MLRRGPGVAVGPDRRQQGAPRSQARQDGPGAPAQPELQGLQHLRLLLSWTEKAYGWYFNGKLVHKLDKPEVQEPMHVYLGNWVGDSERKLLVPGKLPDDVEVDWVKVWK